MIPCSCTFLKDSQERFTLRCVKENLKKSLKGQIRSAKETNIIIVKSKLAQDQILHFHDDGNASSPGHAGAGEDGDRFSQEIGGQTLE